MPEGEIRSDGYVVHSLEAAIWTLGHSHSFQEAVLKAVNLGDDTDTVGSITGTLAGIYYRDIPSGWMDAIARKQDIDGLLNRFFEFCAAKALKEGDV
ncbi:ADP-ribosylglycohydrolase family protein [Metabacillus sp. 113a]|uniref:ADP-ribosylglycohydrolase family protein n=1 Tax=Metabacillus sp. 113a TaxID=3404706 RepID=UPI003CF2C9FE